MPRRRFHVAMGFAVTALAVSCGGGDGEPSDRESPDGTHWVVDPSTRSPDIRGDWSDGTTSTHVSVDGDRIMFDVPVPERTQLVLTLIPTGHPTYH